MSVTFYSMDAPQDVEKRYDCQCDHFDGVVDSDCPHCEGRGYEIYRSSSLEVQMSNANARDVLGALGIEDLYGGWDTAEEKAAIMRLIIRILNGGVEDPAIEASEERGETRIVEEGGKTRIKTGATVFHCGRAAGYIQTRLEQIQKLLQAAIENDWTVTWS